MATHLTSSCDLCGKMIDDLTDDNQLNVRVDNGLTSYVADIGSCCLDQPIGVLTQFFYKPPQVSPGRTPPPQLPSAAYPPGLSPAFRHRDPAQYPDYTPNQGYYPPPDPLDRFEGYPPRFSPEQEAALVHMRLQADGYRGPRLTPEQEVRLRQITGKLPAPHLGQPEDRWSDPDPEPEEQS